MAKIRHFLSITDISQGEFYSIIQTAILLKKQIYDQSGRTYQLPTLNNFGSKSSLNVPSDQSTLLKNRTMAMVFEKPSLRTRVSFELGMTQLGGHAIYLAPSDIGMGSREEPRDVAEVLSRMADFIMARTFKHSTVEDLAEHSKVPVINALSDKEHPCQILADFMSIMEHKGKLEGLTMAFLGDAKNNVSHTLALGAGIMGMHYRVGAPKGYEMDREVTKKVQKLATKSGGSIMQTSDPVDAVRNADVVITDTWISMGDEQEKELRLKILPPYQVSADLMKHAASDAIFMHCLPAYRDKEVSSEVLDGPQSVVYQEAENRLHAQKGLIVWLRTVTS